VTTLAVLPLLEAWIAENHPYYNPDIRVLPIMGNSGYVAWISREVGEGRADPAESGSAAG